MTNREGEVVRTGIKPINFNIFAVIQNQIKLCQFNT